MARFVAEVKAPRPILEPTAGSKALVPLAGYSGFTVSTEDVPAVERYILKPKARSRESGS